MKHYRLLMFALVACTPEPSGPPDEAEPCLGELHLCDRPLDEITLLMSHNAMSTAADAWIAPNQNLSLPDQLELGVRGLMLDTYDEDGQVKLCHGSCGFGERPLEDALVELQTFLADNPREVLVLVIQDGASPETTVEVFESVGLDAQAAVIDPSQPWPTPAELIASDTRLIVTTEGDNSAFGVPWYQPTYSLAWDNPYSARTVDEFSCELLRGDQNNRIFLLNHFLTAPFASPSLAEQANTEQALRDHVSACEELTGDYVNWISLDFVDLGAGLKIVKERNSVEDP